MSRSSPRGVSRRRFVQTAAAGSAAFAASPGLSAAPAFGRRRGANEVLGLGVIGVGGMGSAHCRAFMNLAEKGAEKVELRAVCDVAKKKMEGNAAKAGEKQGIEVKGYRYYRDLLDDPDVDVVLVASPEHWHAQMAIDALMAGKDVYVEKPMTFDLPDAVRLYRVARESKGILAVGTQYVTDPKYAKAAELIRGGRIGKAVSSETGYCRNSRDGEWNYYRIDPEIVPGEALDWEAWCGPRGPHPWDPKVYARWRRYSEWSTGIIGDLLVHQMTPLIQALDQGWPATVTALGGHYIDEEMDNPDQVNLLVQFEKEHTMSVWGSTCNANGPAPLIRGHKANLLLSGNRCNLVPENLYVEDIDRESFAMQKGASHDRLRLDWLGACRDRRAPLSGVELGLAIMAVVDMAQRSIFEKKTFRFDPETLTAHAV